MAILKEITDVRRGLTPHYIKEEGSPVPLINIKNIQNGKIDIKNIECVNVRDYYEIKNVRVKSSNVLLTNKNYFKSALVDNKIEDYVVSSNIFILKPSRKILPEYLVAFLNSPLGQKELNSRVSGSNLKFLNTSSVLEIPIPLPSLEKQKLIVNLLNDYQKYKDLLNKELELRELVMNNLLFNNLG